MERIFNAVVTDIRLESRAGAEARWQVALDRTEFSVAADAGVLLAVSPGGAQLRVPLLGVYEDEATLWHLVAKPLSTGTAVTGYVDEKLERESPAC